MSNLPEKITSLNQSLKELEKDSSFLTCQSVINEVVGLLEISTDESWKLFVDSNGKIRSNASWFMMAEGFADKRASYKIAEENDKNIDIKAYWIQKVSKSIIGWLVALTPNFEDEPFYKSKNIGIDFIVPEKADRVIVVLSHNYIIRTLELKGELSVTQQEIFAKWLQAFDFSNKEQVHNILWDSFDLEPLNKKFYKEVSSFFVELKQYLTDKKIFNERHSALFTNRLIGRIIFCWFLEKKEIINEDFGYFEIKDKNSTEYYKEKLETLFFKVFNTPINEREEKVDNKTPFLNGGLFEPREHDKFGDSSLSFPADYFDRFFAFLKHYNFTTDESTSSFQQVAIDPEMLGRIFENLLAEQTEETGEQARKAKGAFYTPREIVDYMCKESLREYLKTQIKEASDRDEQINKLLDSKVHEWRDQQRNFRDRIKFYKSDILKALDDLKILDPACGSGAFPMGMMQLLLTTYERLEPRFNPYTTKLDIIKNNIYGVDIEPMAVEISRLRAWLSIVVDESSDSSKIEPLPNLDFKFVCANSLIPLDGGEKQTFDDGSKLDELEKEMLEIRDSYFRAWSTNGKNKLKEKFNKLILQKYQGILFGKSTRREQIESYHPFDSENITEFFDPEFMFGVSGFDVVIGNPPYVEHKKLKGIASQLKPLYEVYTSSSDLSVYFYERGFQILIKNGILSYICTNKFFDTDYGKKLREFLSKKQILKLINFEQVSIFENVLVSSCITITKNQSRIKNAKSIEYKKIKNWRDFFPPQKYSLKEYDYPEKKEWRIGDDKGADILKKIQTKGVRLSKIATIKRGITTGYDPAFILKKEEVDEIGKSDILKPLLKGKDIKRYFYIYDDLFILNSHNGYGNTQPIELQKDYPSAYKHILDIDNRDKGKVKGRTDQGLRWSNLRNCAFIPLFSEPKIIWPLTANNWGFALDTNKYFLTSGGFFLVSEKLPLNYLLGILNSTLMKFCFSQIGVMTAGGAYTLKKSTIERFVIPQITSKNQHLTNKIKSLVDQILTTKKDNSNTDTADLEKEIDQLVYELYGLTEEEIKIVENNTK